MVASLPNPFFLLVLQYGFYSTDSDCMGRALDYYRINLCCTMARLTAGNLLLCSVTLSLRVRVTSTIRCLSQSRFYR